MRYMDGMKQLYLSLKSGPGTQVVHVGGLEPAPKEFQGPLLALAYDNHNGLRHLRCLIFQSVPMKMKLRNFKQRMDIGECERRRAGKSETEILRTFIWSAANSE
jgi:hypothetical protein